VIPNEISLDQGKEDFVAEMKSRGAAGWLIKSATIYDARGIDPRVTAVWTRNKENVAWNVFVADNQVEHNKVLKAQLSAWFRPVFITGSAGGRLLTIYRDDHIGPIGKGFLPRDDFDNAEAFHAERVKQVAKGLHATSIQGYGQGSSRKFAAVFVENEVAVPRKQALAGAPEIPEIDKAVFKLMKFSNIRGASLAIVKGGRLVMARAYTWAEPDYPPVQPTTCFRLGSVSKLIGAISIHQLIAEGKLALHSQLPAVLPLKLPDGGPPSNPAYENGIVRHLIEKTGQVKREYFDPNYSHRTDDILKAPFIPPATLPLTTEQVARFQLSVPLLPQDHKVIEGKVSNFGYFLAGELVKKLRGKFSLESSIASRLSGPLQISRLRSGRSRIEDQPKDEARYHFREYLDWTLKRSVMEPARPIVPREYGDLNVENLTFGGGMSGAAPDIARVLAALSLQPYTPLGRPVVDTMLQIASSEGGGHGFDGVDKTSIAGHEGFYKGGTLGSAQAGVWFTKDDLSHVILWNGRHTGRTLLHDPKNDTWYRFWDELSNIARAHDWGAKDLFPTFGMASFPQVQPSWRRCVRCQSLYFESGGAGVCAAGGSHEADPLRDYQLMHRAVPQLQASGKAELVYPYGQIGWRRCAKCRVLFQAGEGSDCPAGGAHGSTTKDQYRLLVDSPYEEHEANWRKCAKCLSLFRENQAIDVCKVGGRHDNTGSGNYHLAFEGPLKP
jgi:CubicO group peptidase (beta-lactamase class C family)